MTGVNLRDMRAKLRSEFSSLYKQSEAQIQKPIEAESLTKKHSRELADAANVWSIKGDKADVMASESVRRSRDGHVVRVVRRHHPRGVPAAGRHLERVQRVQRVQRGTAERVRRGEGGNLVEPAGVPVHYRHPPRGVRVPDAVSERVQHVQRVSAERVRRGEGGNLVEPAGVRVHDRHPPRGVHVQRVSAERVRRGEGGNLVEARGCASA